MTKEKVLEIILQTRVVAVIRMADSAKLLKVVEAVQAGGVKAIEITMTVPDAIEVIRTMARSKPADVADRRRQRSGPGNRPGRHSGRSRIHRFAGHQFRDDPVCATATRSRRCPGR